MHILLIFSGPLCRNKGWLNELFHTDLLQMEVGNKIEWRMLKIGFVDDHRPKVDASWFIFLHA